MGNEWLSLFSKQIFSTLHPSTYDTIRFRWWNPNSPSFNQRKDQQNYTSWRTFAMQVLCFSSDNTKTHLWMSRQNEHTPHVKTTNVTSRQMWMNNFIFLNQSDKMILTYSLLTWWIRWISSTLLLRANSINRILEWVWQFLMFFRIELSSSIALPDITKASSSPVSGLFKRGVVECSKFGLHMLYKFAFW